jgi:IS5 family transposase
LVQVTVSPHRDGVAITPKLSGDLEVAGMVLGGGTENQSASEDEGLRGGTSPDQGLELVAL